MVLLSIIYYGIFVTIGQLTGGYHADSYLKCNILFSLVSFSVIGMTKLISISHMYSVSIHLLLLIITVICVWRLAPVENINKPLTPKQKDRNHKASLIILSVLCIISSVLYAVNMDVAVLIALTLFSISMLIIIEKMKGGQGANE